MPIAIPSGSLVVPPLDFIVYCAARPYECQAVKLTPVTVELTSDRQRQLNAVQAIRLVGADCNAHAHLKQRTLIAMGWPPNAVLLAAAFTEHNEGHMVVIVKTNQGDLVLDNRTPRIVDWQELPYRWIEHQSQTSPLEWVKFK